MRHIQKGAEPASWLAYRKTPNATYKATADLRAALLHEQGFLCGYCMKRINHADERVATTRIEHIKCQTVDRKEDTSRSLDYNNMILCCDGGEKEGRDFHCDKLKQDSDLSFSPLDERVLQLFTFSGSGIMQATDFSIQAEIGDKNNIGVLNLNNARLVRNRKAVIDGLIHELGRGTWTKATLREKRRHWSELDSDGRFKEFNQVAIYYLDKKLRQST
jgi:uncharacterized protein (TIGR02646 family)